MSLSFWHRSSEIYTSSSIISRLVYFRPELPAYVSIAFGADPNFKSSKLFLDLRLPDNTVLFLSSSWCSGLICNLSSANLNGVSISISEWPEQSLSGFSFEKSRSLLATSSYLSVLKNSFKDLLGMSLKSWLVTYDIRFSINLSDSWFFYKGSVPLEVEIFLFKKILPVDCFLNWDFWFNLKKCEYYWSSWAVYSIWDFKKLNLSTNPCLSFELYGSIFRSV